MLSRILNTFRRTAPFPVPAPDGPFRAIGDVHGCADLLDRALARPFRGQTICVGDYVDRGEHSAGVLRLLQARPDVICLSGNHEAMMLEFLDTPAEAGPRWLRNGGLQTLGSFGVAGVTERSDATTLRAARDTLADAMGADLITWLRHLPTRWQSGNVAVVHAGADPRIPLQEQAVSHLHWGHPEFARTPRADGIWVVHGHTIVDTPTATAGRIAIDTGAYATGCLTMARVSADGISFETVT